MVLLVLLERIPLLPESFYRMLHPAKLLTSLASWTVVFNAQVSTFSTSIRLAVWTATFYRLAPWKE